MKDERRGILIILSSPSGAGKSSIAQLLMKWDENIVFSISSTTRNPRPGEKEGREYNFTSNQLKSSNNNNLKTIKIIGNFHVTLSYEKQRKVIKKFGWSFRLAGFDALNNCLLAEGRVDAVIEANLKPYDILPLIPIIKNSGAIVTNWKNKPAENGGNILATSNKVLHNKILKLFII